MEKEFTHQISFSKLADDKHLVAGIVLVPDIPDSQGDIFPADVIEEACHRFAERIGTGVLKFEKVLGKMHKVWQDEGILVENYIAPVNFVLGDQSVPKGAWIIVVKVKDEDIWQKIKSGEYTGFSMAGDGLVEKL